MKTQFTRLLLALILTSLLFAQPLLSRDLAPRRESPEGMVLIRAGTFQMGSDAPDARRHLKPAHTVHLDAFYIDIYPVTNAQFKKFVDANPAWSKDNIEDKFHWGGYLCHWTGTDYPPGKADHPVVWVSWYAALAYAEWTGKRLPTEAEWEYATRGGLTGKKYPWGDAEPTPDHANYGKNVNDTTPVGTYPPNGYELYDMAGNVWEWCLDAYDEGFYFASHNSRNPVAVSGGKPLTWLLENFKHIQGWRVVRGGSWHGSDLYLRVAERAPEYPTAVVDFIGFRCVMDEDPH